MVCIELRATGASSCGWGIFEYGKVINSAICTSRFWFLVSSAKLIIAVGFNNLISNL